MTEHVVRHFSPEAHFWGWEVPVYLFLGGVTAGIMILTALMALQGKSSSRWARWLPLVAPVLLSVGMLALFLDLENKWNVCRFFLSFQPTSPMSWGSWLLLLVYPSTVALGAVGLTADEAARVPGAAWLREQLLPHRGALCWANVLVGIGLGVYTGMLLGTLAARPVWNSALLGPLFLASGVSTGAALMMLFPVDHDEHRLLLRWDMAVIGAEIGLLALYLAGLATSGSPGLEGLAIFMGGPYTVAFWALVVVTGLGVPLLLEAVEYRQHRAAVAVVPALVLVGGFALRWVLVGAGQL